MLPPTHNETSAAFARTIMRPELRVNCWRRFIEAAAAAADSDLAKATK